MKLLHYDAIYTNCCFGFEIFEDLHAFIRNDTIQILVVTSRFYFVGSQNSILIRRIIVLCKLLFTRNSASSCIFSETYQRKMKMLLLKLEQGQHTVSCMYIIQINYYLLTAMFFFNSHLKLCIRTNFLNVYCLCLVRNNLVLTNCPHCTMLVCNISTF